MRRLLFSCCEPVFDPFYWSGDFPQYPAKMSSRSKREKSKPDKSKMENPYEVVPKNIPGKVTN